MNIMERHSSLLSYLTSAVMGLSVSERFGIALGIGTFLINWYYKAKEARRNAK